MCDDSMAYLFRMTFEAYAWRTLCCRGIPVVSFSYCVRVANASAHSDQHIAVRCINSAIPLESIIIFSKLLLVSSAEQPWSSCSTYR